MEVPQKDPLLIRFIGRVGGGLGTGGRVLAEAALREGYHVKAFADYPLKFPDEPSSFSVAFSRSPLYQYRFRQNAEITVLFDFSLGEEMKIEKEGIIMINTRKDPKEAVKILAAAGRVFTFNASEMARYFLGKDQPNLITIAALMKVVPLVNIEVLTAAARDLFAGIWEKEMIEKNIIALKMGYNEMAA